MNTRIAPSPTGNFHLGTARTAYFNYLAARASKGKFILRIDDTDFARSSQKDIDLIYKSMDFLGLDYDHTFKQSDNLDLYKFYLDKMKSALRVDEGATFFGDTMVVRSNGIPTYNFASVIDDITQGIDTIIRGVDHIPNTPKQQAIFDFFNYKMNYVHVGLIFKDGKKLSKRDGAADLFTYESYGQPAILNALLKLGWNLSDPNIDRTMPLIPKNKAIEVFLQGTMRPANCSFDENKLKWFTKQYKLQQ